MTGTRTPAVRLLVAAALTAGAISAVAVPAAAAGRGSTVGAHPSLWRPQGLDVSLRQAPAVAPAGDGWATEPTPNPAGRPNGRLLADSCASPRACIAVGTYVNGRGTVVALAERWNGSAWAIQADPAPPGSSASELDGVSCSAADACVAVGYDTDRTGDLVPLAQTWDGTHWAVQAVPAPTGAVTTGLFAVACPSARACTAVGEAVLFTGQVRTLAERWNGTRWTIQAAPTSDADGALFAVSCPTAASCTAGGAAPRSDRRTGALAERWNGTGWTTQRVPDPAGAVITELAGLSCVSAAACTTTGFATNAHGTTTTLAEGWNGTRWAIQPTPSPGGNAGSALNAVSCLSATRCTAVGGFATATGAHVLAETWNGTTWARQPAPNPPEATVGDLTSVSCSAPAACVAAGFQEGLGSQLPLAEGRAGATWSVQAVANPSGARPTGLIGVSCPSRQDCMAVGFYARTAKIIAPLAEAWDGRRWRLSPATAPLRSPSSYLEGVSCTSPTACVAVGFSYLRGVNPSVPLAETWNGTSWSIQRVPVPNGARQSSLFGVACASAHACTAVGTYDDRAGTPVGLAERWNGTRWAIQAIARPAKISFLSGVACPAVRTCLVVGYDSTGASQSRPFAEEWDGTGWRVQRVPLPAHVPGGTLRGISCLSSTVCTAAGSYLGGAGGAGGPMAERWDGTRWSNQAAPDPPGHATSFTSVSFFAVSCSSATSCAAVGNYDPRDRPTGFAETWNGARWRLRPVTLPPGAAASSLYGVSCTRAGCTGTGSYDGVAGLPVTLAVTRPAGG